MSRPVAVILPGLLQRLGIQAIFERYFSAVQVEVFESPAHCPPGDDYLCLVTDAATYIAESDFFLHRRSRCAVLVAGTEGYGQSENPIMIPVGLSLEDMIDRLGVFLANMADASQGAASSASQELSAREIQVLQLIVSGVINKDIAARLNISINTVLTHRKNITAKLGIKTVSGLTLYALMNGYISPDS